MNTRILITEKAHGDGGGPTPPLPSGDDNKFLATPADGDTGEAALRNIVDRDIRTNHIQSPDMVLKDNSNVGSVFWGSRLLANSFENFVLDYDNLWLIDANNFKSVDWGNRKLNDSFNTESFDWELRTVTDAANRAAADFNNRTYFDNLGNNALDLTTRRLYRSDSSESLDGENSLLLNAAGVPVLDYANCELLSSLGGTILTWLPKSVPTGENLIGIGDPHTGQQWYMFGPRSFISTGDPVYTPGIYFETDTQTFRVFKNGSWEYMVSIP